MKRKRGPLVLYQYQEEGVQAILKGLLDTAYRTKDNTYHDTRCFLLHDEMGLGKTIQTWEALYRIQQRQQMYGRILIVAPSACLHVWTGDDYQDYYADAFAPQDFHVVSYDTLVHAYKQYIGSRLCSGQISNEQLLKYCQLNGKETARIGTLVGDDFRRELLGIARSVPCKYSMFGKHDNVDLFENDWACLVMDEAHKFKNPNSARAKAIGMLTARLRLCLTGTPIMNHGGDLMSIFKYGLGLHNADWNLIHANPNDHYCTNLLAIVSLGRKKSAIDEMAQILPKRQREAEVVRVKWTDPQQRDLYVRVKNESLTVYDQMTHRNQGESAEAYHMRKKMLKRHFMTKMQLLRQICLHPGRDAHLSAIHWSRDTHAMFHPWIRERVEVILQSRVFPPRATLCLVRHFVNYEKRMLQPSPKMLQVYHYHEKNRKIVVYSTFRTFLEGIMHPWLDMVGIGNALLVGGISRKRQEAILEQFKTDPHIEILLVVKSVGAEGINLQDACNHCIIMDPHFNGALDEQASQRIDRIGQKHEVFVRRLFMEGSIDEAMRILQNEKQIGSDAWFGKGTRSLESQGLFIKKYDTV